jgi:hypothetical protein
MTMTRDQIIKKAERIRDDRTAPPKARREAEAIIADARRGASASDLSDHERRLLARMDGPPVHSGATMQGAALSLNYLSPEAAARRAEELRAQGAVSRPASIESVAAHAARFERQ